MSCTSGRLCDLPSFGHLFVFLLERFQDRPLKNSQPGVHRPSCQLSQVPVVTKPIAEQFAIRQNERDVDPSLMMGYGHKHLFSVKPQPTR